MEVRASGCTSCLSMVVCALAFVSKFTSQTIGEQNF